MATQQEIVKAVMNSLRLTTLTGTNALDEAIRTGTNYKFSSLNDLKTQYLDKINTVNDSDTFLKKYCGIILKNDDTGAITGSDAGNGLVKTKESTVLENGGVNDWDYVAPGSVVVLSSGLKVNMPSAREDGLALTTNDLFILKGLPHWLKAGIELNKKSYGLDFSGTDVDTIYVTLYKENDHQLASCGPNGYYNSAGKATRAYLKINLQYCSKLDLTDENGKDLSSGQEYLDRTIAHELNHAILAANIKQVYNLPAYITEGSAELLHGVDDTRSAISVFAGDANLMKQALTSSGWTDYPTVYGGNGAKLSAPAYAGGYTLWRYMAKQSSTSYVKTFNGTSDAEYFETENNGVIINGAGGNDSIYNGSYKGNAHGGNGVSMFGGAGNDTLYNMQGESFTLSGGNDDDELHNNNGNYFVMDGGSGNDYFNNYNGQHGVILGGEDDDSINNQGSDVTISGGSGNDTVWNWNASVSIAGNDGTDTLWSDGNNVTLNGGKGNDSLYNRGGSNVLFQYQTGGGNDTIWGFNETSTLKIDGTPSSVKSGSDIIVTVGNGYISLVGAANLSTVNIDSAIPSGVTLTNTESDKLFEGTDYDDNLTNKGDNITIDGGAGDDSINNYGSQVTINGGLGNDSIDNTGAYVTINAGAGNDTIFLSKAPNYESYGEALIQYDAGNGNDLIKGFSDTSTLQIGDGSDTYSKATLNGDIIVTVGDNTITFKNAASLDSSLNILGTEVSPWWGWRLNGMTATYGTGTETLVTVNGVKSLDGILLEDNVVTISAASLDKNEVTISDGYTLALGTDVSAPKTVSANYDAGTQTYTGAGKTAGYTLSNNAISYSASTAPTFKFSGIADNAITKGFYVNASKKTIAIGASAINSDKTIPVKLLSAPAGYKMELGSSLPKAATISANT